MIVDVFEAMRTNRAIRRYADRDVPDELIHRCLEAATWAPSGGNRQAWRFCVLRSAEARHVLGPAYRQGWAEMAPDYGLDRPQSDPAKARLKARMDDFVIAFESIPAYVLFCAKRRPWPERLTDGASIFPSVQNFMLAARALGLGTVLTGWFVNCEDELRRLVGIPDDWAIAALVTVGFPAEPHVPVVRRAVQAVACADRWDRAFAPGACGWDR